MLYRKIISTMLTTAIVLGTCLCNLVYVNAETVTEIAVSGASARTEGVASAKFSITTPGFAGKLNDDISNTITLASDSPDIPLPSSMKNGSGPRYEISHGMKLSEKFTFQFSFYADGDAVAGLCFHWSEVFKWYPDGRIMFNSADGYNLSGSYIQSASAERGKWHTVALTYEPLGAKTDSANAKQYLYLDGKLIASGYRNKLAQKNTTGDTTMRVVMLAGSGAGKLAVDDIYAYTGDYDCAGDSVSLKSADGIVVDDSAGTIFYDEAKIKTVSELKTALSSLDGTYSEMTLFHNDYTELNTYLPSSAVCVFKSTSKRAMRYYALQSMYGADDVEITCENGAVSASANVHNHHAESKYATMIIAVYNTSCKLVRIGKTDTTPVTGNCTLQTSSPISSTEDYKLILIESLDNMNPVLRNRAEPAYVPVGNGGKIWDVNFDTPPSFTVASYGNDIKITKESDGNKALLHKRTGSTSAFHTDVKSVATQSECVVYAYDIKILNLAETQFSVQLKDYDANYSTMLTLKKNGQLTLGNSLQTLAQNVWYKVSVIYDYHKRSRSFYLNGNLVSDNVPIESGFGDGSHIDLLRFQVDNAGSINGNVSEILIDNVKVYELPYVQDDISSLPRVITIDRSRSIFDEFDSQKESAVKSAYLSSSLKGLHPRIQATASDFNRIRADYGEGDSQNLNTLARDVLSYANQLLSSTTPVKYELSDGGSLIYVSRDVLTKMYVLGMAYQLTGDQKYADRAWIDLQAVCSFPDWHPIQDLDCAEMAAAVSVGYDWMYDAFTSDQLKTIEQAMHDNFFYAVCNGVQYSKSFLSAGHQTTMNQNLILNGAITMSSLAFMDVYPEITAYMLANSLQSVARSIVNFAPDGAWVEGPHYWEYAMQYTAKLLSSLDSALGTCFDIDKSEGLDEAAYFILYMQASHGIFNYGDGLQVKQHVPEILWLANKYENSKDAAAALKELSDLTMANYEDRVLALLWLDESVISDDITLPLDSFYQGENVVTFRDKWSATDSAFVGIHGGKTVVDHSQLDGGSFVFDAEGYRWAVDQGMTSYDLPNVFDTKYYRWRYYLNRAEAHNTLVIDPDAGPDHTLDSVVTISKYETADDKAIAVADTSQLYKDKVTSAKRGFFFTDDRKSLVVRDEIALTGESDVYWFMQTTARTIELDEDGKGALLTNGSGQQLRLDFISSDDAEIVQGESKPLPTSPVMDGDTYIPQCKRIYIKMKSDGNAHITVKLTPVSVIAPSDVSAYDKSIDTWTTK